MDCGLLTEKGGSEAVVPNGKVKKPRSDRSSLSDKIGGRHDMDGYAVLPLLQDNGCMYPASRCMVDRGFARTQPMCLTAQRSRTRRDPLYVKLLLSSEHISGEQYKHL